MARYFEGDCGDFAVALHRLAGGTLTALVEHDERLEADVLIHAFLQCADGTILDSSGDESSIETMLDEFPHCGGARVVRLSEKEVFELAYGASERVLSDDVFRDVESLLAEVGQPRFELEATSDFPSRDAPRPEKDNSSSFEM